MRLLLLVTTFLVLKECYSDMCAEKTCVNKCCPATYYVWGRNKCVHNPGPDVTTMPVYDAALNKTEMGKLTVKPADNFYFHTPLAYYKLNIRKNPYYVTQNGTLQLEESAYPPNEYCVDYYTRNVNISAPNLTVWLKLHDENGNTSKKKMKYGLPVSCVFLFLVLVVYCLLPELRTLGGLVLMAYVATLMLSYIILFSFEMKAQSYSGVQCIAMTLVTYFSFLSAFCWMNVMSYDIWWTFSIRYFGTVACVMITDVLKLLRVGDYEQTKRSTPFLSRFLRCAEISDTQIQQKTWGYAKARIINRRGGRFKFMMYCLYAFGLPLAMTVVLWILNVNAKKLEGFIVPDIPVQGCFISGTVQLLYLYLPMLILLMCNLMFFILTAVNIRRLKRGSETLRSEDSAATGTASARNSNKQRFIMYLKLSTVMGLNWVLEVVSAAKPDLDIWYVTDGYNILIGVVIFLIFVCNRKIFTMLKKRFKQQKLGPHQISTSFHSRSRSTLESNTGSSTPLKPREMQTFSFQP